MHWYVNIKPIYWQRSVINMLPNVTMLLKQYALDQRLTAEMLLAHVLTVNRAYLHTYPQQLLTSKQLSDFETLMNRWMAGEPLAYLTGYQSFWSLDLQVTPATLIPRPETELLVELALQKSHDKMRIADLGTGCGAIALALASEKPAFEIYATDLSADALRIAQTNAEQLSIKNIVFKQGDWCDALPKRSFDMIVSNPPYVAEGDIDLAQSVYDYEPHLALFSDNNGLSDIQGIILQALSYLKKDGFLLLEHGFKQAEAVRNLLANAGFADIKTALDLAGLERVTLGVKR